jgi:hypothetical protein
VQQEESSERRVEEEGSIEASRPEVASGEDAGSVEEG